MVQWYFLFYHSFQLNTLVLWKKEIVVNITSNFFFFFFLVVPNEQLILGTQIVTWWVHFEGFYEYLKY